MPRNTRPYRFVQQYHISPRITQHKYFYASGSSQPVAIGANGFAVATAVQGQTDHLHFQGGGYAEYFQTTAQTILPLVHATRGLDIGGDQVDNESCEIVPGGNKTVGRQTFVAGTDDSFFIRALIDIEDADGMDQFLVGFRKVQAFQVPTSFLTTGDALYTDFAGIGFAATVANPNIVRTATDINDAGSTVVTSTGFAWADTLVHQLEVRVLGRTVKYFINGVLLGNPVSKDGVGGAITAQSTNPGAAFTFDSGDSLVPFIFVRQDAALTPVYLRELEVGQLVDRGLDPNAE